jgi:hypothetical protein
MSAKTQDYPWFGVVDSDDEIMQGDILEGCPVFVPPEDLFALVGTEKLSTAEFKWEERDVIVMTQSCDLSKGREKVDNILLCAVWKRSELAVPLANANVMEEARKGRLPAIQLLAECHVSGFECEVRAVDFRRVYSLPVGFVRKRLGMTKHLRLLPPYREHLSQSFARFFMRVGLPIDIPPFTNKKK